MKKTKKFLGLLLALSIIIGNSKVALADSLDHNDMVVDMTTSSTNKEEKEDVVETKGPNYLSEDFAVAGDLVRYMTMSGQEKNEKLGPDVEMEFPSKTKEGKEIKGIADYAFDELEQNNINVKRIILPEGYEKIGEGALVNSNIKEVIAPSTLKSIGEGAFDKDTVIIFESKEAMDACDNNSNAKLKFLAEKEEKEDVAETKGQNYLPEDFAFKGNLVAYMTMSGQEKNEKLGPDVEMEFPSKTKEGKEIKGIADYAFDELEQNNINVKRIILPEGYEKIGEGALVNSNIKEVIAPSTLKSIGEGAFDKDTVIIFESKEAMDACDNNSNAKLKFLAEKEEKEEKENEDSKGQLSKDSVTFEIKDQSINSMQFVVKVTAKKDIDLIESVESTWEYNYGYHTLIWDMIKKEDLSKYENMTFQEVKELEVKPHYSMGGEINENIEIHKKILAWIEEREKSKSKDDIESKRAILLKLINIEKRDIGPDSKDDYTSDSYRKYLDKIIEAENIVYNSDKLSELDKYIEEVPKYREILSISGVNKTKLKDIIKKAEAEDSRNYASPTFKILKDELDYAKKVSQDQKAVQKVVDEAYGRLELALNNLFKLENGAVEENIRVKVVMHGTEKEPSMANQGIKHDLVRVKKDDKVTYFFIFKPAGMMGAKSDVDGIKDYKTKSPAKKIILDPKYNDEYNRMFILTLEKNDSNRFDVEFGAKMGGEDVVYQPATIVIEKSEDGKPDKEPETDKKDKETKPNKDFKTDSEDKKTSTDGKIQDGIYKVPLKALNFSERTRESMAKAALPNEVDVTVKNNVTKIILPVKSITIKLGNNSVNGHLEKLWLYNNENEAKERKNEVLLSPKKTYEDEGKQYPALYELELKGKAPSEVFIKVQVDAMGESRPNALLKLDWSKAKLISKIDNEEDSKEKKDDYGIKIKKISKTIGEINRDLENRLKNKDLHGYRVFDIKAFDKDGKEVTNTKKMVKVAINLSDLGFTEKQLKKLEIYNNHKNEILEIKEYKIEDEKLSFEADKFSEFIIASIKDSVKPGQDSVKPDQDPVKPGQDSVKPDQDPVKPGQDSVKPNQDNKKPGKASQETPKIITDVKKMSDLLKLEDGKYYIKISMYKLNRKDLSMGDGSVDHIALLEKENGKLFITLTFKGLKVGNKLGYLGSLKYYDEGYAYDKDGKPQGSLIEGDVLETQEDKSSPKVVRIPLVKTAIEDETGFIPLNVFVPVMEEIGLSTGNKGMGVQNVLLKLDLSKIEKYDESKAPYLKDRTEKTDDRQDKNNKSKGSNIGGLKKTKKGPNTSDSFRLEYALLTLSACLILVFVLKKVKDKR